MPVLLRDSPGAATVTDSDHDAAARLQVDTELNRDFKVTVPVTIRDNDNHPGITSSELQLRC